MLNANWHDYKIPTALDVPADKTVSAIDPHDTLCNTAGAKGLGEPATVPAASAVANAVYHAIGIRMTESPITPAAIIRALAPATFPSPQVGQHWSAGRDHRKTDNSMWDACAPDR